MKLEVLGKRDRQWVKELYEQERLDHDVDVSAGTILNRLGELTDRLHAAEDGSDIFAYLNVKATEIVCWRSGHWMRWQNGHPVYHAPTHWMPLPAAPSVQPKGEETKESG